MEHHKYSLFQTHERRDTNIIREFDWIPYMTLIDTYDTLKEAKERQQVIKEDYGILTIIIPTY